MISIWHLMWIVPLTASFGFLIACVVSAGKE